MNGAEFDRHAGHYRQVHRSNIALSGEEPEYFAAYKMHDFAHVVHAAGAADSGRYLDFGSGIGASVDPFRRMLPSAQLVCADVSGESLEVSREAHGDRVEYVLLSDAGLPLADASLDGAFACCVFHHIPAERHLETLRDLRRVMKPGAPLMVYEHNPNNPLTVHAVNTCPLDVNAELIRAPEMARRCRRAGFDVAAVDYRVFFPASLRRLRPLERWLRWLAFGAQYLIHARA